MEELTKHRLKVFGGAVLAILIIGGLLYILFAKVLNKNEQTSSVDQTPVQTDTVAQPEELPRLPAPTVQQEPPKDSLEQQIRRFSVDFTARFGTYSSDGQSANLKQLMPLLTGELKTWAQGIVANASAGSVGSFTGVTTKALSAKVISQAAGSAVVEVSTQRVFTEGGNTRVGYETATLQMTQSGSSWLVSSVKWATKPE